jgi:hypothetical protein
MKTSELFTTLIEEHTVGTFVGARMTRESEKLVADWMRDNGMRKKEPRSNFHITVLGDSDKSFPWHPATFEPHLEIDSDTYRLEKFDNGAIVLAFSIPELEARHEQGCKDHGITWSFPTYQPHLTLSFDPTGLNNMKRLVVPTFPIYVQGEYVEPWTTPESESKNTVIDV